MKHSKCLLLNGDYTPLSIISWKKAIVWSVKYEENINRAIEILDFYPEDFILCSNDRHMLVPAVAKTLRYFRVNEEKAVFSRKNIFLRDNYTCQYCGIKYDQKELTYDHIIPKSIFRKQKMNTSATTWTNITTACIKCNRKKGNKSPKEANMQLKSIPIEPKHNNRYLSMMHHLSNIDGEIPNQWVGYLPKSFNYQNKAL